MHAPAPPPESRTGTDDHFPRLIPVGERGHAIMNGRSRTIPGAFAIASCVITPPLFRPWASWNRRFSQKQLFTPTCIRPIPVALQQKIDTNKIDRKMAYLAFGQIGPGNRQPSGQKGTTPRSPEKQLGPDFNMDSSKDPARRILAEWLRFSVRNPGPRSYCKIKRAGF